MHESVEVPCVLVPAESFRAGPHTVFLASNELDTLLTGLKHPACGVSSLWERSEELCLAQREMRAAEGIWFPVDYQLERSEGIVS